MSTESLLDCSTPRRETQTVLRVFSGTRYASLITLTITIFYKYQRYTLPFRKLDIGVNIGKTFNLHQQNALPTA